MAELVDVLRAINGNLLGITLVLIAIEIVLLLKDMGGKK